MTIEELLALDDVRFQDCMRLKVEADVDKDGLLRWNSDLRVCNRLRILNWKLLADLTNAAYREVL